MEWINDSFNANFLRYFKHLFRIVIKKILIKFLLLNKNNQNTLEIILNTLCYTGPKIKKMEFYKNYQLSNNKYF
jgi:hypothetical protein